MKKGQLQCKKEGDGKELQSEKTSDDNIYILVFTYDLFQPSNFFGTNSFNNLLTCGVTSCAGYQQHIE